MCRRLVRVSITILVPLMVAGLATPAPASGRVGRIEAGHPGTIAMGATQTEFTAWPLRCQRTPYSQGADGWVFDLGSEPLDAFYLTTSSYVPLVPLRVKVTFYSSGCIPLYGQGGPSGSSASESFSTDHPLLEDARWAVVSLPYGANIRVQWSDGPL